jgi:hypothetical protein
MGKRNSAQNARRNSWTVRPFFENSGQGGGLFFHVADLQRHE